MDVMIFAILLGLTGFFTLLAYYTNSRADLFIPAVLLLLIGIALFQGDVTKTETIVINNTTTTVKTALEMPYRRIIALLFMFIAGLFLINAGKDEWW